MRSNVEVRMWKGESIRSWIGNVEWGVKRVERGLCKRRKEGGEMARKVT